MICNTCTPSKFPVRPRNVFGPSSCLAGSILNVRSSKYQPVNARAHSRTSVLAVVADAHGEELHHLAGEVLVRRALDVVLRVEEVEHRGILRDLDRELAQVAGGAALEQVDLLHHLAVVADLVLVRGEVAVPQERHLLLERVRGLHHPVRPPVPRAGASRASWRAASRRSDRTPVEPGDCRPASRRRPSRRQT
jgi:hypothetical protein